MFNSMLKRRTNHRWRTKFSKKDTNAQLSTAMLSSKESKVNSVAKTKKMPIMTYSCRKIWELRLALVFIKTTKIK